MRTGTRWRFGVVATVVVASALFALMSAGVAGANYTALPNEYTESWQCEHCHEPESVHETADSAPREDFTVGAFDPTGTDPTPGGVTYASCNRCHRPEFVGGGHPHNAPGMPCSGCHSGWLTALASAVPWYYDATLDASFNSAASLDMTAGPLHTIHSQPRWPAGVSRSDNRCASCHAIAKCAACHDEQAITHGDHGRSEDGTTTWVARAWTAGFDAVETDFSVVKDAVPSGTEVNCGDVKCHNFSASSIETDTARLQDNEAHGSGVSGTSVFETSTAVYAPNKVDYWRWWRGTMFSRASSRLSNYSTASVTFTFKGGRVLLIGDKDPYRGIANVKIDGEAVGNNVDLYQETSAQNVEVFDSADYGYSLNPAVNHTVTITVTGAKNANARDCYVLVDQAQTFWSAPSDFTKDVFCGDCHRHDGTSGPTDNRLKHDGGLQLTHIATATAGDLAGYACSECHSMKVRKSTVELPTEVSDHELASSQYFSTYGVLCTGCHPQVTPVDNTLESPAWDFTCSFTATSTGKGCHVASATNGVYGNVPHVAMNADHTWNAVGDPASAMCYDCHTGRLDQIHANSITTNATVTTCKTCHGKTGVAVYGPWGKDSCVDAGCHQGVSLDTHTYGAAIHTANIGSDTVATGGTNYPTKACTACHVTGLSPEHTPTKSAGNVTCVECHTAAGTVVNANWPTDKCSDCHYSGLLGATHDATATVHNFVGRGGVAGDDCESCHAAGGIASTKFNFSDVTKIHDRAGVELVGRTSCNLCHVDADTGTVGTEGARLNGDLRLVTTCNDCHLYADIDAHSNMFDHLATAAGSDYVDGDNPTGCAASGNGCHGTNYDLKTVHPASCGSGKNGAAGNTAVQCHDTNGGTAGETEFSSVDRAAADNNNECIECHGGEGIYYDDTPPTPDRVALKDKWAAAPTDSGHYNETTHSPAAWTTTIKSNAGGTTTATCANCHSLGTTGAGLGMLNQHQNIKVTAGNADGKLSCTNCHNYNAAVTTIVTNKSFTGSCTVCHTGAVLGAVNTDFTFGHGTTAPVVAGASSGSYGCESAGTNCHGTDGDLHRIHMGNGGADPTCAGGAGGRACHDFTKQGWATTVTDCDSCHVPGTYANTAHYNLTKHTSTTQAGLSYTLNSQSNTCGACHVTSGTDMGLKQSHEATYATMTPGNTKPAIQICLNCHNNAGSTTAITSNWSTKLCSECHDGSGITTAHGGVAGHATGTAVTGCSASGIGCHGTTSDLSKVGVTNVVNDNIHTSCLRCHSKTGQATWSAGAGKVDLQYNPTAKQCGSAGQCHTSGYNSATYVHSGKDGTADGTDADHHLDGSMTGTLGTGANNTCASCHSGALLTAHSTSAVANTCLGCHNSTLKSNIAANQVKAGWDTNDCLDCHTSGASATKIDNMHSVYGTSGHDGVPNGGAPNTCNPACHATRGVTTNSLVDLHDQGDSGTGCYATGACHGANKAMSSVTRSCGGDTDTGQCHLGYNDGDHGSSWDHLAAASGYNGAATYAGAPAGCTGSGSGCHGTETNVGTIHTGTAYATCASDTSCHAPAGPSAFSSKVAGNNDCVDCHSGAYGDTADRNLMTDAYPNGHYNDTTHTADGTYMATQVDGGTYTLGNRCNNCHDDSLRVVHTGTTNFNDVVCVECHTDSPLVVKGNAWQASTAECSDCHTPTYHDTYTAGTHTGTDGTLNCASSGTGCHATSDLRDLHKAIGGTAITAGCGVTDVANGGAACHSSLDARPSAKSCGTGQACHTAYTETNHYTISKHSPTSGHTEQSGATTFASTACGSCHDMELGYYDATTPRGEHGLTTSKTSTSGNILCTGCHSVASTVVAANWSSKDSTSACAQCHTSVAAISSVSPIHATANGTGKHTMSSGTCAGSGIGCHNGTDFSVVGAVTTVNTNIHANCLRCHDKAGLSATTASNQNLKYSAVIGKTDCVAAGCHSSTNYTATQHAGYQLPAANGTDADHHQAGTNQSGANYTLDGKTNTCASCHSMVLGTEHARSTSTMTGTGANNCLKCHNDSNTVAGIVKGGWTNKNTTSGCSDCHANSDGTSAATAHANTANHATGTTVVGCSSVSGVASGAGCHGTSTTPSLTTLHSTSGCLNAQCHSATTFPGVKLCGTANCHPTTTYNATTFVHNGTGGLADGNDDTHHSATGNAGQAVDDATYTLSTACTNCHSVADLSNAHQTTSGSIDSGNLTCRGCHNDSTLGSVTQVTGNWTAKTCEACHTSKHTTYTLATHTATTGTCAISTCHNSGDVRAIHDRTAWKNSPTATGCSSAGADSKYASNPTCHTLDGFWATGSRTMSCGNGGTGAIKCHINHDEADGHTMPDHKVTVSNAGGVAASAQSISCMGDETTKWGCHFNDLSVEHAQRIPTSATNKHGSGQATGTGCRVCHTDTSLSGTAGDYADNSIISSAVTNGNKNCSACHTETTAASAAGAYAAHQTATTASSIVRGQTNPALEFQNWTSGGGHSTEGQGWPKSYAGATINGVTLSTGLTYQGSLVSPWTTSSVVKCSDCHYSSTAAGPQGATTEYWLANATKTPPPTTGWWTATSNAGVPAPCSNCHSGYNAVHTKSKHSGMVCASCHVKIPHAWKRPRLLKRTVGGTQAGVGVDAAPYVIADATGGDTVATLITAAQIDWQSSGQCITTQCSGHGNGTTTGTFWP